MSHPPLTFHTTFNFFKQFFLEERVNRIKHHMDYYRFSLLALLVFGALDITPGNAQGGGLLIQQYQKGPALDGTYSRWTLYPGVELNYINTDLATTKPKIALGGLLQVEFRVSSTVGLKTGVHYTPIAYSYPVQDSVGVDQLRYWTLPMSIMLHPTQRVSIGLGALYNLYNQGAFVRSIDDFKNKTLYPKAHFRNSFGGFVQVGYHFLQKCYAFLNYRWAARSNLPTLSQTNTSSGFQLGVTYTLWASKKRR